MQYFLEIVNFFYFLVACFLAFYIPASLLLERNSLRLFQKIVIAIPLGMALWGIQGFVFGYTNLRFLSYVYLVIFFLIWLKTNLKNHFPTLRFPKVKVDWLTTLLLAVGTILQVVVIFFNGIIYSKGMYFCCGAVSDLVLHMELTNSIVQRMPPYEYLMHGVVVHNYHYFGNLVIAELVRVFHLPLIPTIFQYFSILLSLFLGLLAIVIGQLLGASKSFTRWLLFFLYFGGDLIYVIQFAVTRQIHLIQGPLENGVSYLNNPPRAFAIDVLFAALCLMILWVKKKDWFTGVLIALLLGTTIGFKVYVGIFAIAGFGVVVVYNLLLKKSLRVALIGILLVGVSLLIYLPVNRSSGGLFFAGFWRFEDFIIQPAMGLSHLELAREIYYAHHSWLRVLQYDLLFGFLYVFGIFGTKILGFFQNKKSLSLVPFEVHLLLLSGIFVSFLLGIFFLQKTGIGNEFNFIVSIYIIGSFYTALACSYWTQKCKKPVQIFLIVCIVLLTLPRIVYEESKTLQKLFAWEGNKISKRELNAMAYMREKTPKSSLVFVQDPQYLSAVANRPIFVEGSGREDFHGVIFSRAQVVRDVMKNPNPQVAYSALKKNNISYLYLDELPVSSQSSKFLKTVYSEGNLRILQFLP